MIQSLRETFRIVLKFHKSGFTNIFRFIMLIAVPVWLGQAICRGNEWSMASIVTAIGLAELMFAIIAAGITFGGIRDKRTGVPTGRKLDPSKDPAPLGNSIILLSVCGAYLLGYVVASAAIAQEISLGLCAVLFPILAFVIWRVVVTMAKQAGFVLA